MSDLYSFVKRIYTSLISPPQVTKSDTPIKFGILGAAKIAPSALVIPARSHAEVVIHAVAARSLEKAQEFAAKHGIEKVYGGPTAYQDLLDNPDIDAIYNPLPNGLHYEWTMKALLAGKHVLLEKPSADTSSETRKMFDYAEKKGLVLLEAFHNRFHPANQRLKAIVDSGELGAIKSVETIFTAPKGLFIKDDDIRFDYALGGGALMDMGCYCINYLRYVTSSNPTSVISASSETLSGDPNRHLVDMGTTATLAFPSSITGTLTCHLGTAPKYGFLPRLPDLKVIVVCEGGEVNMFNFALPSLYHYIQVSVKDGKGGKGRITRVEKVYSPHSLVNGADWKGEEWWSSYRYQLEAFVDKVKGRTPQTWPTAEDSIANMEAIEMIYNKTGLGIRPASTFQLPVL